MLRSLFRPLSNIQRLTYVKKKKKKCAIPDCLKLALFSHSQQGATHLIHCSKVYYRRKAPSDALLDVKFLCSDSSTLASGWTDTFNLHRD